MKSYKFTVTVLVFIIVVMSLAACAGDATPTTPLVRDNLVYSRQPAVQFLAVDSASPVSVDFSSRQGIQVGDAVTVDDDGQARLRFSDFLVIDVYRNSEVRDIQYSSSVDPDAPPAFRMRLKGGSVFSNLNTQEIAGQRVKPEFRVDTDWAVIKVLGTRFWVHYDKDREITWVVVKEGDVSVEGAGVEVIVHAGYQTWVEPGKPPVEPVPACRNLIGNLFPLIEELTNQDRDDLELLCKEGPVPTTVQPDPPTITAETATPTVTRRPSPTRQVPPTDTPTPQVVCPVIQLSDPGDGAVFTGTDQGVTLVWQSSRQLAPDEYFIVTSNFDHNGEIWTDTQQTSESSLTLPIYLNDLLTGARQLEWSVSVWRKDETGTGTQICPTSPSRRLTWEQEPTPTPTDTPTPEDTPTPTDTPTPDYCASCIAYCESSCQSSYDSCMNDCSYATPEPTDYCDSICSPARSQCIDDCASESCYSACY